MTSDWPLCTSVYECVYVSLCEYRVRVCVCVYECVYVSLFVLSTECVCVCDD